MSSDSKTQYKKVTTTDLDNKNQDSDNGESNPESTLKPTKRQKYIMDKLDKMSIFPVGSLIMLFIYGIHFACCIFCVVLAFVFSPESAYIILLALIWSIFQLFIWNEAINAHAECDEDKCDWAVWGLRFHLALAVVPYLWDYVIFGEGQDFLSDIFGLFVIGPIAFNFLSEYVLLVKILTVVFGYALPLILLIFLQSVREQVRRIGPIEGDDRYKFD